MTIEIFTIGFTKKNAEQFFGMLRGETKLKRVIDTRLNNVSQLAGFSKRDDLKFFLQELGGIDYAHDPDLAPTQDILDAFKKKKGTWRSYTQKFKKLMQEREIENKPPELFDGACLLCSEDKPHHCHRRLVAEYLKTKWRDVKITHLPPGVDKKEKSPARAKKKQKKPAAKSS